LPLKLHSMEILLHPKWILIFSLIKVWNLSDFVRHSKLPKTILDLVRISKTFLFCYWEILRLLNKHHQKCISGRPSWRRPELSRTASKRKGWSVTEDQTLAQHYQRAVSSKEFKNWVFNSWKFCWNERKRFNSPKF